MTVRFRFKTHFALLCLPFFILCLALGIWQWHRYLFKKELLMSYQQSIHTAPVNLLALPTNIAFQHVKIIGKYLNHLTMLVQNTFYKEQSGYEVLTPVQIPNEKKWLIVDRGWVSHFQKQSDQLFGTAMLISGYIKLINEYQFILGKNILAPNQWPLVMQKINFLELQTILKHEIFPFILRLDPALPYGYIRDWTITTVEPERHLAYAIQWFSFACVILVGFTYFCCEKICE